MNILTNPKPKVPNLWLDVLTVVQRVGGHPEAVIAGGALRDLVHGKTVRDVDIFLNASDRDDFWNMLDEVSLDLQGSEVLRGLDWQDYVGWEDEVRFTAQLFHEGTEFNFIGLTPPYGNTPKDVIDRIDFGLCKVAHNGFGYCYEREFQMDSMNKTFTLYRINLKKDRSLKRFERLTTEKYQGYSLVDLVPDTEPNEAA